MGKIQREDMNVHWQIGVSLVAAFKRGETCECPRWTRLSGLEIVLSCDNRA
jgi:hypothetical protein